MPKQCPAATPMSIDAAKAYRAKLAATHGDVVVALHTKDAPVTANNFVFLAQDGFYDGAIFHRGGPGYQFGDRIKCNANQHERGVLWMAEAGPDGTLKSVTITAS